MGDDAADIRILERRHRLEDDGRLEEDMGRSLALDHLSQVFRTGHSRHVQSPFLPVR
jgi:hypothetical protein